MADLRPGDTVWLTPRTLSAPLVCYSEPSATVSEVDHAYVVVTVDGQQHRVHQDNVRRSDPKSAREARPRRPVQLILPDDCHRTSSGKRPAHHIQKSAIPQHADNEPTGADPPATATPPRSTGQPERNRRDHRPPPAGQHGEHR